MTPFGPVWSRLVPFGPRFVPDGPCLTLFDPVWPRLVPVNISPRFAPFGTVFPIWLRLAWFGLFDPIYTLVKKLTLGDNCHGWTPTITIHRMVPHPPKDGHLPTQGCLTTRRRCTTDLEFGTYTSLKKLTLGDNCHGWTPTIHRMVPHPPKDGPPPT